MCRNLAYYVLNYQFNIKRLEPATKSWDYLNKCQYFCRSFYVFQHLPYTMFINADKKEGFPMFKLIGLILLVIALGIALYSYFLSRKNN